MNNNTRKLAAVVIATAAVIGIAAAMMVEATPRAYLPIVARQPTQTATPTRRPTETPCLPSNPCPLPPHCPPAATCGPLSDDAQRVSDAGIENAHKLSGHSFRRGFVTDRRARGATQPDIAEQTRHKSLDTLRGYSDAQSASVKRLLTL